MVQDPTSSDGKSGEGSQADEGKQGSGIPDPKDNPKGEGNQKPKHSEGPDDPITPRRLNAVLDARSRKEEARLKQIAEEFNKPFQEKLEAALAAFEQMQAGPKPSDDEKQKHKGEDQEKVELKRRLDELTKKFDQESEARLKSEMESRDYKFETLVKNALVEAGCTKPDYVFRVIKPELELDKTGKSVFATVKTSYGEEELTVADFIKRIVKEEMVPELFSGFTRSGSPASGDGGGKGGFDFSKDEVFDARAYMKDPDKYRQAIEQGRVKGLQKGST